MIKIRKGNYGDYSSDNYGAHTQYIEITTDTGWIKLYFSYDTVVAFRTKLDLVIHENDWGPTTGKHLNWINSRKDYRVGYKVFNEKLDQAFKELNISVPRE